ncbi:site-specific DNA-methyltransferase [Lysinibacillus endophyticus]|uniref:site-specific DNA-methyltransferase n=1 Tax=Ureibacillus endophyticus TaxID=1978490 RepID=UPI00209FDF14|nr:site-specific DNA-methyltransferase [Lysinibacillus endophyticus]MCP1144861.1 site-specific DNA-methyltransferase [Lysinibacillus endophyticus]
METKINKEIREILEKFGEKYLVDGVMNKSKVIQDLESYNEDLLTEILSNSTVIENFTKKINNNFVLQINKLIEVFESDEYWEDSYTKYSKKIGLTSGGKFIDESTEVVLDFPYKDTILKASMSKEDTDQDDLKPNEPFLNEVIAKEEIDVLLDNKILANVKKFSVNGEEFIDKFTDEDNLIIRGNNLLALSSIASKYNNRIKLIYIDVPYYFRKNVSTDTFKYNSNFKLSTWLTFMKNRLELAYEMLSEEGVIFIHSNDESQPYLKVLCDEIFDSQNFLNTIAINLKNIAGASGGGEDKRFKKNVEYINIYAKNYEELPTFKSLYSYTELSELLAHYKEVGISWKYTSVLFDDGEKNYLGETVDGNGDQIKIYERINPVFKSVSQIAREENLSEKEVYYKYLDKIFQTQMPQSSIRLRVMEKVKEIGSNQSFFSIEYTPKSGRNKGKVYEQFYKGDNFRLLAWLKDVVDIKDDVIYKKDLLGTYWDYVKETKNLSKEGQVILNNGKKPEKLLKDIIECATDENDIVMDFFLGSGTTAAVAHKLGRQYVGIEQLDYGEDDCLVRMKNVINGEQSGISKDVEWQGGGSFIYAELMEKNSGFIKSIISAKDKNELANIFELMLETADLDFRADLNEIKETVWNLELENQKRTLIKILDKNQLYYNYSEIEDTAVRSLLSKSDYVFNKSFYQKRGE